MDEQHLTTCPVAQEFPERLAQLGALQIIVLCGHNLVVPHILAIGPIIRLEVQFRVAVRGTKYGLLPWEQSIQNFYTNNQYRVEIFPKIMEKITSQCLFAEILRVLFRQTLYGHNHVADMVGVTHGAGILGVLP